jgi:hypothetical protein
MTALERLTVLTAWTFVGVAVLTAALAAAMGLQVGSGTVAPSPAAPTPSPTAPASPAPAATPDPAAALSAQQQLLQLKLDYAEKNLDRMRVLVSLLTGLGTIFAVLTVFGAKQVVDTSKREFESVLASQRSELANERSNNAAQLGRLVQEFESGQQRLGHLEQEIRAELPTFGRLERALRDLQTRLLQRLALDEDWRYFFEALTEEKRQEYLLAELTIAGFELLQLERIEAYRRNLALIHQWLGRFYASKYLTARQARAEADRARALVYLRRAVDIESGDAAILSDLGVVYAMAAYGAPPAQLISSRGRAAEAFRACLKLEPKSPEVRLRALYGLSWFHSEEKEHDQALTLLAQMETELAALTDPSFKRKYEWPIRFNRACCLARLAAAVADPLRAHRLDQAAAELELGRSEAELRGELSRFLDDIRRDLQPGGDLDLLARERADAMARVSA